MKKQSQIPDINPTKLYEAQKERETLPPRWMPSHWVERLADAYHKKFGLPGIELATGDPRPELAHKWSPWLHKYMTDPEPWVNPSTGRQDWTLKERQLNWITANAEWGKKGLGTMANMLVLSGLVGLGHGAVRQLPKMLELRKLPKVDDRDRRTREKSAQAAPNTPESEPQTTSESVLNWLFGGFPQRRSDATWAGLPPGLHYLAGMGLAAGGGYLGGRALVDTVTDMIRARQVKKRREELRREFEQMLQYNPKTASAVDKAVEALADHYADPGLAKSAVIREGERGIRTSGLTAMYGLYALLAGLAGAKGGYALRQYVDPLRQREEALRLALAERRKARPLQLELEPAPPEEVIEPEVLGPESDETVRTRSIGLPAAARSRQSEIDEALDLMKLSAVSPDSYSRALAGVIEKAAAPAVEPLETSFWKLLGPQLKEHAYRSPIGFLGRLPGAYVGGGPRGVVEEFTTPEQRQELVSSFMTPELMRDVATSPAGQQALEAGAKKYISGELESLKKDPIGTVREYSPGAADLLTTARRGWSEVKDWTKENWPWLLGTAAGGLGLGALGGGGGGAQPMQAYAAPRAQYTPYFPQMLAGMQTTPELPAAMGPLPSYVTGGRETGSPFDDVRWLQGHVRGLTA